MTTKRVLVIAITLLFVVVLAGGGVLAWVVLRAPAAETARLVVADGKSLRVLDESGERVLAENALTTNFSYPATSPDGRRLAYVARDGDASIIVVVEIATDARIELYRSQAHVPIDLAWSPDGKYLVFLSGAQLTAEIVPTDGSRPARLIAEGSPSFFAWSPDSANLLLHLGGHTVQGGRMSLFQPGQDVAHPLLGDPGFFQAPAWSLDGQHFFYVAQPPFGKPDPTFEDVKSEIMRVTAAGKDPVKLASEAKSDLRIIRSPVSDQIAYMVVGVDGYGPLKLVDGAGGDPRTLSQTDERVTAFFWSPDGKQIAYLTHDGEFDSSGKRAWHVVDTSSGTVRSFEAFQPSDSLIGLQSFFDAYTFSFSPWSPDSTHIAYGADDGVYTLDVAAGTATRRGNGALGVWIGGK